MASPMDSQNSRLGTLERGLSILEFLAEEREASSSGIVDGLGFSRSATYRILDTLRELDYVETNPASGGFRLGMKTVELGLTALSGTDVVRLAPPHLHNLVQKARETVFLAVMDNNGMIYIYKEEGPQAVKMSAELGSRRPLYCTSLGKAYLSALPDKARQSIIGKLNLRPYTANTITDAAELEAELVLTSGRGYAIDRVEIEEGVACCGAAVCDHRGLPIAAISIAGPADRMLSRVEELGPLVAETATFMSKRLGCVGPNIGDNKGVRDRM